MPLPILTTKLYIPQPRTRLVTRTRLIRDLNEGMHRSLTLLSAPAGFGKTTLLSEWVAVCERPVAWLSMDEGDNDPQRFLSYVVASLQRVGANLGQGVLEAFQSPQPISMESILTTLLNHIAAVHEDFTLVLDDCHVIHAKPVDDILSFVLENMPPPMHLVIATREDPRLPLARLRVRGQLMELRASDLRFTSTEATRLLNQVKGLNLSTEAIASLSSRTEGWIAGLQLAALSIQGEQDAAGFIQSFNGSHRFVLDYLIEEVLQRQDEHTQRFFLLTSVLDRMCGPLCDAVLQDSSASSQATLEHLEHANQFIVPLDNERRWYRYHHLFADLLRQQLLQNTFLMQRDGINLEELHRRASVWYEEHDMEIEAFHHAVASQDLDRAAHLVEGSGMPLHFRGAVFPVLHWLESLPKTLLDARPSLWVMYASALSMTGQTTGVEERLQAAEAALRGAVMNEGNRNLIGHIAAIRALLAAAQYRVETIIDESQRALEYLSADNLPVRTATMWKLGYAYQLQGNRAAAKEAYNEAIAICRSSGNNIIDISATIGLGSVQESDNELNLACQTYHRALQLLGEPPPPGAFEALLGLARIHYQWNDLEAAERYGQLSLQLARQLEKTDRCVPCAVFLAMLCLARGDVTGASARLTETRQFVEEHNFIHRIPEVTAAQILIMLRKGQLKEAEQLVVCCDLPIVKARIHLSQEEPRMALAVLERWQRETETKGWVDEQLKVAILQAIALSTLGDREKALQVLENALTQGETDGFIRIFIDEDAPMAGLLAEASARGIRPDYVGKLFNGFAALAQHGGPQTDRLLVQPLIEPLSRREVEVLRLIAQGLSNREIGERLFLALSTIKGHTRNIFEKLQVQRRTEAIARARELGLLA